MPDPLSNVPLSAIRVFEAAARQRSFTRAADELGISQAAVSWQVKSLERRLGQVLFDRRPKEVALTPRGELLARAATDALGLLRTAISDLADAGESVLVLTTTGSFATLWLAPRIGGFQIAHPNIAVSLDATSRRIDLMRENVDAAVRPGSGDWPDQESVYLFPAAITPLCTPEFARRHGLTRPQDLLGAPRIGLAEDWSAWFEAAGATMSDAPAAPTVVAKQQSFEVASALGGRVAALASRIYFAAEVNAGRLIQPFETMLYQDRGYWLTYRKDRRRDAKIIAFRDWLLAVIAADPAVAGSPMPSAGRR
jgi:LysR family glycine cleavage system transcriptional activator